jgi:hypothetical protein
MKPVYFFLFRPQSAKEEEYLSFLKLQKSQNGNPLLGIMLLKIMSAKDI